MKKIVALALALLMVLSMGTVALAADYYLEECVICGDEGHLLPGETYPLSFLLTDYDFDSDSPPMDKRWKVSTDWEVGGALVKAVYWDKDFEWDEYQGGESAAPAYLSNGEETGAWVIEMNENYTITELKRLEGTITFEPKGINKENGLEDLEIVVADIVSNHLVEVIGEEDADDVIYEDAENNTVYQCVEDEAGYVGFNSGKLLSVLCDLESEEKVFAYNNEEMIEALAEKFPEADIECYNFGAARTLQNEAKLTLQADYADQYYVYTYNKGVLEAQDYTWNDVDGVYEWNTKTLGAYVISDVELVAAEEETKNPDTGANDVVGAAAALAVVALVAGAAVSMKK